MARISAAKCVTILAGLGVVAVAALAVWLYRDELAELLPRAPDRILLVANGVDGSKYNSLLIERGFEVDVLGDETKLTTFDLPRYAAIVLLDGANWQVEMPAAAQRQLVEFIRAGGGLVFDEWVLWQNGRGNYATLAEVLPQKYVSWSNGVEACTVEAPEHPIASGLPRQFTLATTHGYAQGSLHPDSVAIVSGTLSRNVIVTRRVGKGRVVEFSIRFDGTDVAADLNLARAFANAVEWAAGAPGGRSR